MQENHLFTCPKCGHEFSVSESSAGETIPCPGCQQVITMPTLGALRQLPVQTTPIEAPAKNTAVSAVERRIGLMLAFGAVALVFIILTLIWGWRYYYYYNIIYGFKYEDWNIFDAWTQWQFLRPGVDTPLTEDEQNWFYQLRMLWNWIVIYLTITGICLAGVVYLWLAPIRREVQSSESKKNNEQR